jgi:hypothetical protein
MAEPVKIEILLRGAAWALTRDGEDVRAYGHADVAVHDAVRMARELIHTGQPAKVQLHTAHEGVIDIEVADAERRSPMDGDERSAVVPGRSASA